MASHLRSVGALTVAGVLFAAQPAGAQVAPQVSSPVRGWVLAGSAGVASAAGDNGASLGAAVAWNLAPRWGLELGGQWLARPTGQEAWAVAATTQFRVLQRGRAIPYVHAGLAAFTMTLDSRTRPAPDFYRARVHASGQNLFRTRHTFTDPAIVLGGGVDVAVGRNVHVRPSMEALMVVRDRRTFVVPVAAVQVSYHFESGRITPARGR
jgi:hypothetical protein